MVIGATLLGYLPNMLDIVGTFAERVAAPRDAETFSGAVGGPTGVTLAALLTRRLTRDITLAELSIELFYPSDPETDTLLHQIATGR